MFELIAETDGKLSLFPTVDDAVSFARTRGFEAFEVIRQSDGVQVYQEFPEINWV